VSGIEDDLDKIISARLERNVCPVIRTVETIERQESAEVAEKAKVVAEDLMYSANKVAGLLRKNGYQISKESILRHRHRGTPTGCICE